jgi:hypothetical protein
VAAARLTLGEGGEIHFIAAGGGRVDFLPGRRASVSDSKKLGMALEPAAYPRLSAPFLSGPAPGRWSFAFGGSSFKFEP